MSSEIVSWIDILGFDLSSEGVISFCWEESSTEIGVVKRSRSLLLDSLGWVDFIIVVMYWLIGTFDHDSLMSELIINFGMSPMFEWIRGH